VIALVQPTQVFAHPRVELRAPVDGSTVSGVVERSECEASASSDTRTVDFYLDGRKISWNLNAPWNCRFDASALGEGSHTLRVVAGDSHGDYTSTEVRISTSGGQSDSGSGDSGSGGKATLRPVGSGPLGDAEAASRVRPRGERRPGNSTENQTTPTRSELERFYAADSWGNCNWLRSRVTGNFTGTTDEVIQWAAHKWGLNEDVVRAVAVKESNWNQGFHGDIGNGDSYGLMQVKSSVSRGTYPLSRRSTAFNVDYYGASQRYYLNGCADWMDDQRGNGRSYSSGDQWGSVGAWFSGRWYDYRAEDYIAAIKRELSSRKWENAGF
jgi:autotransporter family porin